MSATRYRERAVKNASTTEGNILKLQSVSFADPLLR
jgi:hypothetical protein